MDVLKIRDITNFFNDDNGKLAVVQRPNALIIIWAGLSGLSKVANDEISGVLSAAATLALVFWAYLEIKAGESMFRRLLGAVVLAFSIYGVLS